MTFIAINLLKLIRFLLKITGRGNGTALPGVIGEKLFFKNFQKLAGKLDQIVIITGTNGKTTTSKIVRTILKQNKVKVLANISGANLTRGIIASLAFNTNFFGKLKSKTAIFEVEEASMSKVVDLLSPHIAVVTNLFRDQMDAYGELDHTREVIEAGLKKMDEHSIVLLNANDPRVTYMNKVCVGKVKYFGLDDMNIPTESENAVPDSIKSHDERSDLKYSHVYFSHIGIYKSEDGKFTMPKPDFSANNYSVTSDKNNLPETNFSLVNSSTKKIIEVKDFKLLGLYNILNCLTAFAVIELLINDGLNITKQEYVKITAAFGRGETIIMKNNCSVTLLLVKNPTGFNSALGAINDIEKKNIILALNDNTADGKDVSWIWDCNFEAIKNYKKVIVAGKRVEDLALRCKYAEVPSTTAESYADAVKEFTLKKDEDGYMKNLNDVHIFALCSYTALLKFREYLATIANIKKIDQEI